VTSDVCPPLAALRVGLGDESDAPQLRQLVSRELARADDRFHAALGAASREQPEHAALMGL
jgi:hypothetical protein